MSEYARQFERTLEKCGVSTQAGIDYVKQSLDPFHDWTLNVVGVPDRVRSRSIVHNISRSIVVTAPTAAAWDAHIALVPFAGVGAGTTLRSANYTQAQGELQNSTAVALTIRGPMVINTVPSGNPTFSSPVASATNVYSGLGIDDVCNNSTSSYRVVSAALEVIDRTATVSQQGSVTAYKLGYAPQEATIITIDSGGANFDQHNVQMLQPLPSVLADVEQISVYKARSEEGLLMPFKVDPDQPRFLAPENVCLIFDTASVTDNALSNGVPYRNSGANIDVSTMKFPMEQGGALFTGLAATAALEVRLRMIVEEFPAPSDSSSMTHAHPSPAYDKAALDCVPELFDMLPIAVPVSENAKGDWWQKVLAASRYVAREIAPSALDALGSLSLAVDKTGITQQVMSGLSRRARESANRHAAGNAVQAEPKKSSKKAHTGQKKALQRNQMSYLAQFDQTGPKSTMISSKR